MTCARLSSRGNPCGSGVRLAEAVAGLVEVQPGAVGVQVDQVRGARAVHVGQPHPPLVEVTGLVQPRAAVHGHLRAEPAEAGVRPVADLAVAHPDQVGQAVAGHVRQVDGLLGVGEHQPRAPLLVPRLEGPPGAAEALVAERRVPGERVVTGDQDVGEAVPVEVDHAQVGVVPGDVGVGPERAERLPAALVGPLVEAGHRAAELDQVQVAVAGQVEQLLPAARSPPWRAGSPACAAARTARRRGWPCRTRRRPAGPGSRTVPRRRGRPTGRRSRRCRRAGSAAPRGRGRGARGR